MSSRPRQMVVSYDIRDPKRLRAVYRLMRSFGDHLQYSVFLCELSASQKVRLMTSLERVIKPSEDQVLFIDLGFQDPDRRIEALGVPWVYPERTVRVF